jgi:hypothetical protein
MPIRQQHLYATEAKPSLDAPQRPSQIETVKQLDEPLNETLK